MATTMARDTRAVADAPPPSRGPLALAILLIVGGAIGLLASFELTIDKFQVLEHPTSHLGCTVNATFQCGKNLASWQGAVFGFPNPVLGLMMFPVPILIGVALLAAVRFPSWFFAGLNVGMLFAIGFVAWLVTESIFSLSTLCPWCVVVYAVVIPMSLAVTTWNLREGHLPFGAGLQRLGSVLYGWVPLMSIVAFLTIIVIAQVQLGVVTSLLR